MPFSPLPYNISRASELLRRDVRGLQAKYAARIKSKFADLRASRSTSPHDQAVQEDPIAEAGGPQCVDVEISSGSEVESEKGFNTLYDLLESSLWAMWTSRDFNMSLDARFKFRGNWLVLFMAIQACPCNDRYKIFMAAQDDKKMVLWLLHMLSREGNVNDNRLDSMFSDMDMPPSPSPAQMWLAILKAKDAASCIAVAEDLLGFVWPEKNASATLNVIGNHQTKLSEADDAELRAKLRKLLFPEYEALVTTSS
jgi:hypothetical protein